MEMENGNVTAPTDQPDPAVKTDDTTDMVRWRKTGGGSFRMGNGRIIKPNQVFWAAPEDIPKAFRDVVIPLTKVPPPDPVPEAVAPQYEIQSHSPGWYDIVDGQGKVVNERALRRAEADDMLAALTQV